MGKVLLPVLVALVVVLVAASIILYGRYMPSAAAQTPCRAPAGYQCGKVDDFALSYYRSPQTQPGAMPVLILHGGPGFSSAGLRPQFAFLEAKHPLYLYDQRGAGYSESKPALEYYRIEKLVEEIETFRRDIMKAERLRLIGHSSGAYLAMKYAARYPDRVDKLVLVSPPVPSASATQLMRLISLGVPPADPEAANQWLSARAGKLFTQSVFLPETATRIDFRATTYANMIAVRNFMLDEGIDVAGLQRIKSPVLMVVGNKETPSTSEAAQRQLQAAMPGAQLVKLARSGHWSFLEEPEAFQRAVWKFFGGQ